MTTPAPTHPDTPAPAGGPGPRDPRRVYWRRTRIVTFSLLAVWLLVTLAAVFLARELDVWLFGWPLSFWFGAQGALLAFLAIVWTYDRWMTQLERRALQEGLAPRDPAEPL